MTTLLLLLGHSPPLTVPPQPLLPRRGPLLLRVLLLRQLRLPLMLHKRTPTQRKPQPPTLVTLRLRHSQQRALLVLLRLPHNLTLTPMKRTTPIPTP